MPIVKRQNPQPFLLEPSGSQYGNDGRWYTFKVRAGTPPQGFNVLVSLSNSEVWLPNRQGCEIAYTNVQNCGRERGVDSFNSRPSPGLQTNLSSTWSLEGDFALPPIYTLRDPPTRRWPGYEALGATYGNDTFGLEDTNGPGGPTLEGQLIGTVAQDSFWLGVLGLGTQNAAVGRGEGTAPSVLSRLLSDPRTPIPSLSYGFTAGATYKASAAPASLVLGGYDRARAGSESISIALDSGSSTPFNVGLRSVRAESTPQGAVDISEDQSISVTLESLIPEIWLPQDMCDRFEAAFGLRYDEDSGRYYYANDTVRESLANSGTTVTFTLGEDTTQGNTIDIVLPFGAFDLEVSRPIQDTPTPYFPLRRATTEDQYLLGRTFLQEAYIIADWGRNRFNLSAASYSDPMPAADIVPITTADQSEATGPGGNGDGNSSDSSGGGGGGLSGGAIGGIVVGVIAGLALLGFLIWWFLIRKRKDKNHTVELEGDQPRPYQPPMKRAEAVGSPVPPNSPPPEFEGSPGPSSPGFYAPQKASELPTPDNIHELQGSPGAPQPDPLDKAGRSLNAPT